MRISRLTLALAFVSACQSAPPPRDQWTIVVATDAQIPQFADRLLVEVSKSNGELACASCRRLFGVGPTSFPLSFGVTRTDPPPIVRARLYRADHVGGDGLPLAGATMDSRGRLPEARGVTAVGIALRMDCYGIDSADDATCDASGALADVPVLASPRGLPNIGSWKPGLTVDCRSAVPEDMRCIPGGALLLGDVRVATIGDPPLPERLVQLSPFALDEDEMSVGKMRELVAAGAPPPKTRAQDPDCTFISATDSSNDAFPINCVSRSRAAALCVGLEKRLPTEAEWEYAAAGRDAKRLYPWADANANPCDLAIVGRGRQAFEPNNGGSESTACRVPATGMTLPSGLVPGGSLLDRTPEGLRNLGGSLSEWVQDDSLPYDSACWSASHLLVDPSCAMLGTYGGTRGNEWRLSPNDSQVAVRALYDKTEQVGVGIRCAKSM